MKRTDMHQYCALSRIRPFNQLLELPKYIDPNDRMSNPQLATAEELAWLPGTVLGIAGMDPLRDEAVLYARKLKDSG